jgi:hypothetical protein
LMLYSPVCSSYSSSSSSRSRHELCKCHSSRLTLYSPVCSSWSSSSSCSSGSSSRHG